MFLKSLLKKGLKKGFKELYTSYDKQFNYKELNSLPYFHYILFEYKEKLNSSLNNVQEYMDELSFASLNKTVERVNSILFQLGHPTSSDIKQPRLQTTALIRSPVSMERKGSKVDAADLEEFAKFKQAMAFYQLKELRNIHFFEDMETPLKSQSAKDKSRQLIVIMNISDLMAHPKYGVPSKKFFLSESEAKSFVAKDAVGWLLKEFDLESRRQALYLLQLMHHKKLIKDAKDKGIEPADDSCKWKFQINRIGEWKKILSPPEFKKRNSNELLDSYTSNTNIIVNNVDSPELSAKSSPASPSSPAEKFQKLKKKSMGMSDSSLMSIKQKSEKEASNEPMQSAGDLSNFSPAIRDRVHSAPSTRPPTDPILQENSILSKLEAFVDDPKTLAVQLKLLIDDMERKLTQERNLTDSDPLVYQNTK